MKSIFYIRYALRSLRRGGQRTVLAMLCIAFGVMALVAMQMLSLIISDALLIDPRLELGGDARLDRGGQPFTDMDLRTLERWQADGTLDAYSLVAPVNAGVMRAEGTGRVYLISRVYGVDPETYPLVGDVVLASDAALKTLLAPRGHVVVTFDLATKLGLAPGSRFSLAGGPGQPPVNLEVAGILQNLPDHKGDTVLMSLESARHTAGGQEVATQASIRWGAAGPQQAGIEASGWTVHTPEMVKQGNVADLFDLMLRGAGLLGLLIGGIGAANTMQVILAGRMLEVAMLKTVGYQQRDLMVLFGVEAIFLGLVGGLLGVLLAIGVAGWLMHLLNGTLPFMLEFTLAPHLFIGGLLAGVLTALIFGLVAMVRASAVRPSVLLRNLPERRSKAVRAAMIGLYLVLVVLFSLLSSFVMGSFLEGTGVVVLGLLGLLVFGLLLGGILLLVVRLPAPAMPLLGMARRSLRHRPIRAVAALVALFVGIFSIGFALASLKMARETVDGRYMAFGDFNLVVYSDAASDQDVREAVAQAGIEEIHTLYRTPVLRDSLTYGLDLIEGRSPVDARWNLTPESGAWQAEAATALAPLPLKEAGLQQGDTLRLASTNASAMVTVAGFYALAESSPMLPMGGLLVDRETALRLGGAQAAAVHALQVPEARLSETTDVLGRALPEAMVLSSLDLNAFIVRIYEGLFLFVVAVAALALVAGMVLIANAVGLAMLERRRELGILKSIGYSSNKVLQMVLLENGILGLISGLTGIVGVWLAIRFVAWRFPATKFSLDPLLAVAMVLIAIGLALGSATLVAWRPTHLRPLAVLREE